MSTQTAIDAKECPVCGNIGTPGMVAGVTVLKYCDHFVGWTANGQTVTVAFANRAKAAQKIQESWHIVFDEIVGRVYKP